MKNWTLIADKLKDKMASKEPEIRIRDIMGWFDLSSPGTAHYYLLKLEEYGAVKHVKDRWFLAW